MVDPGVAFAAVINAVVVVVLVGAGAMAYRWPTGDSTPPRDDEWCAEAVSLLREVQQIAAEFDPAAEHDRLQRDILPLAARLRSQARTATGVVAPEVARDLHALSVDCYALGMEVTTRDAARLGAFIESQLDARRADAAALESVIDSYRDEQP